MKLLPVLAASSAIMSSSLSASEPEDPFLWLEQVESEEALGWVEARNEIALAELTADDRYAEIREGLLEIYNSKDRIPSVSRHGDFYYNFWQDDVHVRGIWRRCTPESYATDEPAWATVLDIDALAEAEKVSWVWKGATVFDLTHELALLRLSDGGKDAVVVREFNLVTQTFVEDGFTLPEARNYVSWLDEDTLLVGSGTDPLGPTESGYPRVARLWKRGTAFEDARKLFTGEKENISVYAAVSDSSSGRRVLVGRSLTFFEGEFYLAGKDFELSRIPVPLESRIEFFQDQLLIEVKKDWEIDDATIAAGSFVAINLDAFMAGSREFDILFAPEPRVSMARSGYTTTQNFVVLNLLDNVNGRIRAIERVDGAWRPVDLETGGIGNAAARAVDSDLNDEIFLTTANFLEPSTLSLADLATGEITKLKQTPTYFDKTGLAMSQHEATAPDGTKIPYFQVSRADLKLDGSNPTLLYGYGGFQVSMQPGYSGTWGRSWLERGGVYILANIRGGGEFGPSWHQAALKGNRQVSWDDFAAIGEHLIERGVTSPPHLGIMGGSQGGLLVGVAYTQRPDLWGAVVCQVPLLDMLRYHKLLAGASWVGEYGDPEIPEERDFIAAYSPYQNIKADSDYPRILFVTSTHDDRVHPAHARKMAARLEEMGHDFLYWENTEGGHGGAANNAERAQLWGLGFTFLWRELGGKDG